MDKCIKKVAALFVILFLATGCFKRDDLEDVNIYTTVYPIQYVTDFLYGYNSKVKSIYPAETVIEDFELTKKQVGEYALGTVFVYNGLTDEKFIARDLLNENNNLKIINVSQGLEYVNSVEELWLNPSDFLMLAHNVKNGLEEYISNKYIIEEINKNYEDLKVLISSFDAELQMAIENASDKNILIANDTLSFLSKYGFSVTNVDSSKKEVPSTIKTKAKALIKDKSIKFIYMLDTDEKSELVTELEGLGAEVRVIRSMTVLSEEEVANDVTYKNMMRDNIEAIKEELYS
ncbi:MAG TPA: hypothetical protein DCY94_04680 [Firmicutes bacterium]|nr:hypothetical protein [Bacillota bacterium]